MHGRDTLLDVGTCHEPGRRPSKNMERTYLVALAVLVMASSLAVAQDTSKSVNSPDDYIIFEKEQSVYVVAVEAASRDLSLTRANLEIERRAKQ